MNEKAELTWQQGTFLTCQMQQSHSLSLYALGNFYVELVYDPERNQIVNLIAFKDTARMAFTWISCRLICLNKRDIYLCR